MITFTEIFTIQYIAKCLGSLAQRIFDMYLQKTNLNTCMKL